MRCSSVRFMTGITASDWSGVFNADPITIPLSAYRHWLEQGWATAAVLCNQLEACVDLHGTITSVLSGSSTRWAIFKMALTTCYGSGTQRICWSPTWNCCFRMDSSQSCWQKKSEPKMQLEFSRLALITTSCSYEPPAIPIWTVAVPNVRAAKPSMTSRRKSSSLHLALLVVAGQLVVSCIAAVLS